MSLLSALNVGGNALTANQIGLNVTGHNIANANTPGYVREVVNFSPAPTQRVGNLNIGLGVQVSGIVQVVDEFVLERLRGASADVESGQTQEQIYLELEALLGELSDADLSTAFTQFFSSIEDVVNQPESTAVRNVAVLEGQALADTINRLADQVGDIRQRVNDEVVGAVDDVNRLLKDIADLNVKIINLEGGNENGGQAVSLRDQRGLLLDELSGIINVTTISQDDGSVSVLAGGEFLVSQSVYRSVEAVSDPDDYLNAYEIRIAETGGPLNYSSGRLDGLVVARDQILGGFEQQLDDLANTLIHEFNRLHSQGQGLEGFQSLTSEYTVDNREAALDAAGLPFTPENGSLVIQTSNRLTGETLQHVIPIELNGLESDTTVDDFRAAIDAIDGLTATISNDGRLQIGVEGDSYEFSFLEDTSGVLAAYGVNTFFTGQGARNISVNQSLIDDPARLAASQGGPGNDVENALRLASFGDLALESRDGRSINQLYSEVVAEVSQGAATTSAVADGYRAYAYTLESQHLSISGVNLDEEALNMLAYQRSYQAAARFITTVNEMLDVLLSI